MENARPLLQINAPFTSSCNIFLDSLQLPSHGGNRIEAKWYPQANRVVGRDIANFPGKLLRIALVERAREVLPDKLGDAVGSGVCWVLWDGDQGFGRGSASVKPPDFENGDFDVPGWVQFF
jgi:hypothetical protein